jgi:hypothetical protein
MYIAVLSWRQRHTLNEMVFENSMFEKTVYFLDDRQPTVMSNGDS